MFDVAELFYAEIPPERRLDFQLEMNSVLEEERLDWRMADGQFFKVDSQLLRVYQHSAATPIVQAKVLEIKELKSGFQGILEGHLKGSSDWRAWSSIVGSTLVPRGKRNQMLKYIDKASRMNAIVAAAVERS